MPCGKDREETGDSEEGMASFGLTKFLQLAEVTVLSDRRITKPYGLEGGEPGQPGRNYLKRNGIEQEVAGKCSFSVEAGDALIIEIPGGGGYGTH
jgi:N-methylhydantoinase B/oxoprolinase/acetone carboxylase alpha subunit